MGGPEALSRVGLAEKVGVRMDHCVFDLDSPDTESHFQMPIWQVCAVRGYPLDIQDPEGTRTARIAPVARASMDLGFTSPLNIAMVR